MTVLVDDDVEVRSLVVSRFAVDAGGMFGVVPRAVWGREVAVDERHRMALAARVLLVSHRKSGYRALIDTGTGDDWSDDEARRADVDRVRLTDALRRAGVDPDSITDIVLTHLHWDHTAGLSERRDPEAPSIRALPRATVHVGGVQLEHARHANLREQASFRARELAWIDRGACALIDREGEVLPSLRVRMTVGHSPGMLVVEVAVAGRRVVFASDLVPTRHHARPAWGMTFDGLPITAVEERRALLDDVARDGALLVPCHDPTVEVFRVRRVRDRFEVVLGADDLTPRTRISSSPPGSRIYAVRDHEMSVVMDQHIDETRVRARVLFVDDEVQMTTAIRRVLSREPFEVIAANSVTEAFALFEENDFDIVVSDELMPEMSGSEFLARIRREHPFTVRILLTGRASLDTAIHAVNRAGVFRFLQKPCNARDLIDSLHDAVEHRLARVLQPPTILPPPPDPAVVELQSRYERAVHGLWMAVQPVVSVTQRTVYAYECLVRTREPSVPHGGAFVELAERVGSMQHLDRSIRVSVAEMLEQTNDTLTVLVNLHPSSLDDPDLLSPTAPLSRHARRVVLELTERASLHDLNAVREKVTALRALGYRIAVDDLGAGYAGLTSLALLHPEIVKLDMELVRGVHITSTKAKLVAAVITLCRELGAEVIAEGVETDEEYKALRTLGCSLLQGYYFARPGEPFPDVRWP